MGRFHDKRFPGESDEYRAARDQVLAAENELRRHIEDVAALRRGLPPGGDLREDYVFAEGATDLSDHGPAVETRFSDLFEDGRNSLVVYSFMYGPDDAAPCPTCTSMLDGLNGSAPHIRDRVNLVVVARSPIERIRRWAMERGWGNLRLLSSAGSTYNGDYYAESPEGDQIPALNVFQRTDRGIHHVYNTELLYASTAEGQHPRHVDMIWPVWNLFDLTPEGRGTDWFPRLSYT